MLKPRRLYPGPLPRTKLLHSERRSWAPFCRTMFYLILVLAGAASASFLSLAGMMPASPDSADTSIRDEQPALPVLNEPIRTWRAEALGSSAQFATPA